MQVRCLYCRLVSCMLWWICSCKQYVVLLRGSACSLEQQPGYIIYPTGSFLSAPGPAAMLISAQTRETMTEIHSELLQSSKNGSFTLDLYYLGFYGSYWRTSVDWGILAYSGNLQIICLKRIKTLSYLDVMFEVQRFVLVHHICLIHISSTFHICGAKLLFF